MESLLLEGFLLMHPMVIGELACGTLRTRKATLRYFHELPMAKVASHSEVMFLIEDRRLWGRGLSLVDLHLLGATLLSNGKLWTLDKRLADAARQLEVCA